MFRFLLAALLLSLSLPALAVYKCETSGKVIYSDAPCLKGNSTDLGDIANKSTAADIAQANSQNSQEKKQLKQLETARHKREAEDDKQQQKIAKAEASKKKKCASLALKKKWSKENAENATGKKRESAKRKAHQLAEKYELECRQP
jgi:hypothetical protein